MKPPTRILFLIAAYPLMDSSIHNGTIGTIEEMIDKREEMLILILLELSTQQAEVKVTMTEGEKTRGISSQVG